MNKKILSTLIAVTTVFAQTLPVAALTPYQDKLIDGNSLVIGNYLFELDTHGKDFDMDNFMNAVRSIEEDEDNAIYYKNHEAEWYELVGNPELTERVSVESIENQIKNVFGSYEGGAATDVLKQDHIKVEPIGFEEHREEQGTFHNKVRITLSDKTTAAFKSFERGDIDTITGASTVKTLPEGMTLIAERIDDKIVELELEGKATYHAGDINTTQANTDYNGNGIYGDIKLLLVSGFFENIASVEGDGVYAITDVLYNDQTTEVGALVDSNVTRMVNVEQVHFGVLRVLEGTLLDYNFTLNGHALEVDAIDDAQTIGKFEINPQEIGEVVVTHRENIERTQTIQVSHGISEATKGITDEAPNLVLTSGPVSYFDYFLNHYDREGNVRSVPRKVTFDLLSEGEEELDKTIPKLSSEKTLVGTDIKIMFDGSTPEATQWKENIYKIEVDCDMSESMRVPVQFEVHSNYILIKAESTAIQGRNGKHELVISSTGHNDTFEVIEIVRPAGMINLSGDFGYWANQELLFELDDFNYATTNPIYEVVLDGKVLNKDDGDYHIVSNLVRLKENTLQDLNEGTHTLEVKATGYEAFTKNFTLEVAPNGTTNPTWRKVEEVANRTQNYTVAQMDTVSGASVGGSGGSEGGGGGGAIRANIIFDFDLIANAKILSDLNLATPYAKTIMNWWDSLSKDAIITQDGQDKLIDYTYFKNHAGQVVDGVYQSFKTIYDIVPKQDDDMFTPEHDAIYLNRPYDVKNMLEDGLLGAIYRYGEAGAKESPKLVAQTTYVGDDIIITYDEVEGWEEAIQSVKVGYNYLKYTIDKEANTLIIPTINNSITYGTNPITVSAKGYKESKVPVTVENRNMSSLTTSKDKEGNIYIQGLTTEYAEAITGLSINGKYLFSDEAVGAGYGDCEINGEVIKLRKHLFKDSDGTQQTLIIEAYGYAKQMVTFTPDKVTDTDGSELAEVPNFVQLVEDNTYELGDKVQIKVASLGNKYNVTQVLVDGVEVHNQSFSMHTFEIDGKVFDVAGDYVITLKAAGYKDKEFTVTIKPIDISQQVPSYVRIKDATIELGEKAQIKVGEWMDNDYKDAVTKVIVDGVVEVPREELGISSMGDYISVNNLELGAHTLAIHATNYEMKELVVEVEKPSTPYGVTTSFNDYFPVTTEQVLMIKVDDNNIQDNYKSSIQSMTINDTVVNVSEIEFKEVDEGMFTEYMVVYTVIKPEYLVVGENIVSLQSTLYKDKSFKFTVRLTNHND